MSRASVQAPAAVVMVRPQHFSVNGETAQDNAFQSRGAAPDGRELARRAHAEHSAAVRVLEDCGIRVHLFEGTDPATPDCVFPNNWLSTHAGGHVAIYPMRAQNRRLERRADIIALLKARYRVQDIIDYSGLEEDGLFLEGTGAMVLDHVERVAYAAASDRTSPIALERFCTHFNYEPMVFGAVDARGVPVYHTNVLMCIGTDFALIGDAMIPDAGRRAQITARLAASGRDVISLRAGQIAAFAGNALELQGREGRILALSTTAFDALDPDQIDRIARSARPVPLPIPTIEMAGGSVRCMIAGIHLAAR